MITKPFGMVGRVERIPLTSGLLLIVALYVLADSVCAQATVEIESTSQGVWFKQGGRPVLFYQRAPKSKNGQFQRAGYVHPLYDLDQHVVTEDFPGDHLHQRGVFWAWHQVTVNGKAAGDSWLTRDFLWDVRDIKTANKQGIAELMADVVWKSPAITDSQNQPLPLVSEKTQIRVHPRDQDRQDIDFEIRLFALQNDVAIGGSDDDKGYGGFSCRFVLPDNVVFQSKKGIVAPQRTAIEAGGWIDVSGAFHEKYKNPAITRGESNSDDVKAGDQSTASGIAIFCHPSSAGFPQSWILRSRDSMQNPVYPGRQTVPLSKDKPLVLRYRLVLHRHRVSPAKIENWYQSFAEFDFTNN